jgi:hypothetical protein
MTVGGAVVVVALVVAAVGMATMGGRNGRIVDAVVSPE